MAFLFSSSHLPASRVRRPDLEADDDHDENPEAMPRSGGVRASSHLEGRVAEPEAARSTDGSPAPRSGGAASDWMGRLKELAEQQSRRADSVAPDSGPRRADEEHEPDAWAEHDEDAPPGGVHDEAPEQEGHDDTSSWYHPPESGSYHPDPGFNVRPEDIGNVSSDPGFNIRSEDIGTASPGTGFYQHLPEIKGEDKPAVRADRAPSSSSPDWRGRQSTEGRAQPQGSQRGVGPDAPAGTAPASGRTGVFPNSRLFEVRPHPALAGITGAGGGSAQSTQGGQARAGRRFYDDSQPVSDIHNATPVQFANHAAASTQEEETHEQESGPSGSHAVNEMPEQQTSPAAPSPNSANVAAQHPTQNVETPHADLRNYLKKSGNPFFIKNSYDSRTPLEEKLRLRQLLLSLKAPPGEKLPFFIAHLQHWLNAKNRAPANEEKSMEYALGDFMHFPVVTEGLKKVLKYFGSETDSHLGDKTIFDWLRAHPDAAKPGGVDVPDTYFETVVEGGMFGYPKPGNEAYYYGFGGAPLKVRSSGIKGFVHKNGAVTFRGTFTPELNDTYDWNKGQGTPLKLSPRIPMEMIRKYIPKDIPVISPSGDEISVGDSFFKELQEQGYGRDFKIRAPGKPMTIEFYQARPGAPFTYRIIPTSPSPGQPRADLPQL